MSKVYSTGPIENAIGINTLRVSSNVVVKLLNNNNENDAIVTIKVFSLNGTKTQVFSDTVRIDPRSSEFRVINVANLFQFEVQIKVIRDRDNVLISVFGEDSNGLLVAAHRLVHSELTLIRC